jgi:hypothetical protein
MPFTRRPGWASWKAAYDNVTGPLPHVVCVERYMRVSESHFIGFSRRGARAGHGKKSMDASVPPSVIPLAPGIAAVDVVPAQELDISAWLLRHLT